MIVWLASYPRSGNTLLRTLLYECAGLQSYDAHHVPGQRTDETLPDWGHRELPGAWDDFYRHASAASEAYLVKTHAPPPDDQPAICVVRDGRSACLSYFEYLEHHFPGAARSVEQVVCGDVAFGSWSSHYEAWRSRHRGRKILLRFEELQGATEETVRRIAAFAGHDGPVRPWRNPRKRLAALVPHFIGEGSPVFRARAPWGRRHDLLFYALHGTLMRELSYYSAEECASLAAQAPAEDCRAAERLLGTLVGGKENLQQVCDERQRLIDGLVREGEGLRRDCDERQRLIDGLVREGAGLRRDCDERQRLIDGLVREGAGLRRDCDERQRLIDGLVRERENLRRMIGELTRRVGFSGLPRHTLALMRLYRGWYHRLLQRVVRRMARRMEHLRRLFVATTPWRVKLGVLSQHAPRPIRLPRHYFHVKKLSGFPGISIVTPSLNQKQFIERTILSVTGQGYPRLEYIVQDAVSTDGTLAVLARHAAAITSWESVADRGQSNGLNRAFRRTTGEIMAYLNADDLLLPGALHEVAGYFLRHPDVDVMYGNRILIDEEDRQIGRWVLPPHDEAVLAWADYVPQETLFWRRSLWERVGASIDESFHFAMDWDLILRFQAAGARFARLPRFLAAFRVHRAQKTSAHIQDVGLAEMQRLRERSIGRPVGPEEIGRHIARYIARHQVWDCLEGIRLAVRPGVDYRVPGREVRTSPPALARSACPDR